MGNDGNSASGIPWAFPCALPLVAEVLVLSWQPSPTARRAIHPGLLHDAGRQRLNAEILVLSSLVYLWCLEVRGTPGYRSRSVEVEMGIWAVGREHPLLTPKHSPSEMWGTSWSPPLQGLGCLTALWNDFLNTPCLLVLMPSEASPRVRVQGKDNAARCVWKWWCGARTKGVFLLCPVLHMWCLLHLQSIFQPWTKSTHISWEHTPLPEQLMPGTSQEKLPEYDTPLLMKIKWCHISSALLEVLK